MPSTPSAQSKVSSSSEAAHTAAAHLIYTANVKSIRLESASSPATIKDIKASDMCDERPVEMVVVDTPSVSPDIPIHPRNTASDTTMTNTEAKRSDVFVETQSVVANAFAADVHSIESKDIKPIIVSATISSEKLELPSSTVAPTIRPSSEGKVFIKKEYLPSPTKSLIKPDKTREEVTRFLNFGQPEENAVDSDATTILSLANETKSKDATNKSYRIPETSKENETNKSVSSKQKSYSTETSKYDHKSSSKDKTKSQSSSRRSSSSSNRDCSRCYKRSKIKRTNVGVQCSRSSSDKYTCSQSVNPLKEPTENCGAYPVRDLHCPLDKTNPAVGLKYERFFHIEVHTNGGASVVHLYQDEINELSPDEMDELVDEFFAVAFSEDPEGSANHVMGIVHDAAGYLPDLLEHMSENYSTLTVKAGVMGRSSDIETSTMHQYNEQVIFIGLMRENINGIILSL